MDGAIEADQGITLRKTLALTQGECVDLAGYLGREHGLAARADLGAQNRAGEIGQIADREAAQAGTVCAGIAHAGTGCSGGDRRGGRSVRHRCEGVVAPRVFRVRKWDGEVFGELYEGGGIRSSLRVMR